MKLRSAPFIVGIAAASIAIVFTFERVYLSCWIADPEEHNHHEEQ